MLQLASTLKGLQQQFNDWADTSAKLMGEYWFGNAYFLYSDDVLLQISLNDSTHIDISGAKWFIPSIKIAITDNDITISKKDDIYTDAEAQAALDAVIKTVNKEVAL